MRSSWGVQIESQLFLRKLLTDFPGSQVLLANLFKDIQDAETYHIKYEVTNIHYHQKKTLTNSPFRNSNSSTLPKTKYHKTSYSRRLVKFKLSDLSQLSWQIWILYDKISLLQFGLHIPSNLFNSHLVDFQNFVAVLQKNIWVKIFVHFVHSTLRCLRQQIDKNSLENMEI